MALVSEKAIDKLSKDFPVYQMASVAGKGVEAEIFIPNFGYVTFISGSEELRIKPCAAATARRLVTIASILAPFGTIVVPEP